MAKHYTHSEERWEQSASDPDFLPVWLLLTAPEAVVKQRGRLRTLTPDGSQFWLAYTEDEGLYSLALSGIRVIKDPSLDVVKDRLLEILYSGKPANQWLEDWLNEDPEYAKLTATGKKIDAARRAADEIEKSKLS